MTQAAATAEVALVVYRENQRMVLLQIGLHSIILQVSVGLQTPLGVYSWDRWPAMRITLSCLSLVFCAVPCVR